MAGEIAGSVMILSIEITATPTTFTVLQNQIDVSVGGSVVMADTTSKQSGGFETAMALLKNAVISCTYNPDPTDQAHIDLMAHWDAATMTSFLIELSREDGTGKFAGTYYISNFAPSGPVTDVIKYTLELTPAAAVTLT